MSIIFSFGTSRTAQRRGGEQQATQTVNSDGTQTFGSEVNHDAPDEIPF